MALVDPETTSRPAHLPPTFARGRLSGQMNAVRYGDIADELVVVAEDDGDIAVLIVAGSHPGVRRQPQKSFDPITSFSRVEFDDLPSSTLEVALRGTEAAKWAESMRAGIRMMVAHELAGGCREMLDRSVTYAKERHQFGKPIGTFQAIQHLLADTCAAVVTLEAACEAAGRAAAGDPEGVTEQAMLLKALAAAISRQVGESALQVHGGIAFTLQFPLHRWFQHALSLQGHYGDERELAAVLGKQLLEGR
jgi:alkylation response protein AidB-like acyl-CoA dehydrogenase